MISIIIPVLNPTFVIIDCLESIRKQKFEDWEVVLIDGGFSDFLVQIVNSLNDSRFKLYQELDSGVYSAMNKGIKYSTGKWLYFLGSDDYLFDDFVLSNVWNFIIKTKLPVIYGNVKIEGDTGWAKDGEIYAGYFSKSRMLRKAICHQSIFYKKEFLLQHNLLFNVKYFVSADWDVNLRCRRISKFGYMEFIVAVFKAGGISTTKRDSFPDMIESEFADLFPPKWEILLKGIFKKIISFLK